MMCLNILKLPALAAISFTILFSNHIIALEALGRGRNTESINFSPMPTGADYEGTVARLSQGFSSAVASGHTTNLVNAFENSDVTRQDHVEGIKDYNRNPSRAFTRFGLNLLREIRSSDNVVLSPFSIATSLALIQQGAVGTTKMQLTRALGMYAKASAEASQKLLRTLEQRHSTNILKVASAIFAHNSPIDHFNVRPAFRTKAFEHFNTSVIYDANFDNTKEATDIVNIWVAEQTNGFIQKLLTAESISENTRLVLANAIFFKGKWKFSFEQSQSEELNFTLANGQLKRTQFMHGVGKYKAGKFRGATFVLLPYEGEQYAFMGILPKPKTTLDTLIDNLDDMTLLNKLSNMTVKDVKLTMPKFAIQKQLNLRDVLSRMGVTEVFSDRGSLSKIGDYNGITPVISSAVHSAALIVDETGTTAAAATAYGATALSGADQTIYFWADRPFLGILWDLENSVPLFMTRVEDPTIL